VIEAIEQTRAAVVRDGGILAVRLGGDAAIVEICRAALRGGLRVLELTLTTPGVWDAMRELVDDRDAIVGAGTVLSVDDVRRVAELGGRFAMSPVFDPDVVEEAHRLGVLAVPGAASPAEILAAHRRGARLVKVFPSGALGGPEFLRAVRGPLPDIPLVPTSGPTTGNLGDYLRAGAVAVGVGNEVLADVPDLARVEEAAHRMRGAMDAARRELRKAD
jgi:2-dehydro-3-deoxyphosphogluconate aldolase/(4S)-4-hydroxy-2-oxoglutarate aldolase